MYRWVEHTAELELLIETPTEVDAFHEALAALRELLDGNGSGGERVEHDLKVEAGDRPALLAAWLEELVFMAETEGFVPLRATRLELGNGTLRARVVGWAGQPAHLVKAVTYHRLALEPGAKGWQATVVLDV